MPLFDWIELSFCKVLIVESWNAPAHRYFLGYRSLGEFRHVMGLPVVDEFATFSSPIFFAPIPILGKIYDAGISLGHQRSSDMDIDTGWPPICIGTDEPAPQLPETWISELLETIKVSGEAVSRGVSQAKIQFVQVDPYALQSVEFGSVSIYATDAPLLPKQLKRICQLGKLPFSLAFSTGNRITRQENATLLSIQAVSEAVLSKILGAATDISH